MAPPGRHGSAERRAGRLRRSQDFRTTMRSGRRSRHALLHVAVRGNGLPESRFGFSVGKRVGRAVVRNRVKRRLKAIMRELPVRAGFDVVAVAHELSAVATYQDLRQAALQCLDRAGALRREEA